MNNRLVIWVIAFFPAILIIVFQLDILESGIAKLLMFIQVPVFALASKQDTQILISRGVDVDSGSKAGNKIAIVLGVFLFLGVTAIIYKMIIGVT